MSSLAAAFISLALVQAPESEASRIGRLVERLSADEIEIRQKAAVELRSLGDVSIPALENAAASKDPEVRGLARKLLHDLSATSALIEDLRSDDVPDNARSARAKIQKRYGLGIRDMLLAALRSDDTQQAVQAAFLLAANRDAPAALAEAPEIVTRAVRAMAQKQDAGFRWVAAEAAVQLGAAMNSPAREEAWGRALANVDPDQLHDFVPDFHKVSARSQASLPAVLMRHYLKNLMNDPVVGNARQCRYVVQKIGPSLAPQVRAVLSGYDQQARAMAVDLLLEWNQSDLPTESLAEAVRWSGLARNQLKALGREAVPSLLRVLRNQDPDVVLAAAKEIIEIDPATHDGEIAHAMSRLLSRTRGRWAWHNGAEKVLVGLGPSAAPALLKGLADPDSFVALSAARGLMALDRARHAESIPARAERELSDDARRGNARRASQLLYELGDEALPRLRKLLASEREQAVVCAAAILARLGRLEGLDHPALEMVVRYSERCEEADEPGALVELMTWSEPIRAEVKERLKSKGGSRLSALEIRLLDQDEEPWLTGKR